MKTVDVTIHPASFRDPAGFVFEDGGVFLRQVNTAYAPHYNALMGSGLYDALVAAGMLVPHTEIPQKATGAGDWYKTLRPLQVPFISYPYEWSFEMLKDAALLILQINKIAAEHGMILKDATGFNVQFIKGTPVLIDSLSFEIYDGHSPWIAYRQFCETFLFPLFLAHYLDSSLIRLLMVHPEGIPVTVVARALPLSARLSLSVWLHVFLQRKISTSHSGRTMRQTGFTIQKLFILLDGLSAACMRLRAKHTSNWDCYYDDNILSKLYLEEKEKIFNNYIASIHFDSVIDLGSNNGHFSLALADEGRSVISTDLDCLCIDRLYTEAKKSRLNIFPLVNDLANPSPAIGFGNAERASFTNRARADLVLALALVHHLCLSANIPLDRLAGWLASMGALLIIEFVDKDDEKAKKLIASKIDTYAYYNKSSFERVFGGHFDILRKSPIDGTHRILYLMRRKS